MPNKKAKYRKQTKKKANQAVKAYKRAKKAKYRKQERRKRHEAIKKWKREQKRRKKDGVHEKIS